MEIKINGKPADITLEAEKTVGEVLTGIHQWLDSTAETAGFFVSGLEIDEKSYGSRSLDEVFELSLKGISSINVKTSSWAELMLEALVGLKNDLEVYESRTMDEQKNFWEQWEKTAAAIFIMEHDRELYGFVRKTLKENPFSGSAPSTLTAGAAALVMERIREIEDPEREMTELKPLAEDIAKRLEDLPLDMQTGKDLKAAETITVFSSLVEKIFRLIFLFKHFAADIDTIEVSSMTSEFSAALREMISAYENKDTILVGDLAEYELAPRLRSLMALLSKTRMGGKS